MKLSYGIHHVGINVSDMERALAFYRDLLGMQEAAREKGDGYEVAFMIMPETTTQLELVYYEPNPKSPRPKGYDYNAVGAQHVCIEAKEIENIYRTLKQADMISLGEMEHYPKQGVSYFYAKDPDDSVIEFMEIRPQDAKLEGGILDNLISVLLWLLTILLKKKSVQNFHKKHRHASRSEIIS